MESAVDLYIYGAIPDFDWNSWEEFNTDRDFVQEFKSLESQYDRLNIHINSPGGFISQGLGIFNTIRFSKKETHTYNDGFCASMGAEILLAGDVVHVSRHCMTMIHSGWGWAVGNAKELREVADTMDKWDQVLAEVVADKLNLSLEDCLSQYFDGKDHYLTGRELLDMGLAQEQEEYDAVDVPENLQNLSREEIFNHYSKKKPNKTMNLKDWFKSDTQNAGKKEVQVSAEDLKQLKADAQEALNRIRSLETTNQELTQAKTGLEAQVAQLITEKAKVEKEFTDFKEDTSAQLTQTKGTGTGGEGADTGNKSQPASNYDQMANAMTSSLKAGMENFAQLKQNRQ